MLDIQTATPDYLSKPVLLSRYRRLLCLAPHPDDEVIGCGGLLAMAQQAGLEVRTVILCDGAKGLGKDGGDVNVRENESRLAAQCLGVPAPRFLGWPDRGLRHAPPLIGCLRELLNEYQPDLLILPSLAEPHPDHQALALSGAWAASQWEQRAQLTLLFCEIGAPTQPNAHIDISAVASLKWQAMAVFESQEALHPYTRQAQALAALRALGVGQACQAAEAFFEVSAQALADQGMSAAMPYWPLQRTALGLANTAQQLPLVSILIRSMSRPCLADAVASVVAQTYPNLEVVVVNATGQTHAPLHQPVHRLALRLCETGQAQGRSEAANTALLAAQGEYALFLDDDDLIDPTHIAELVNALQKQPHAVAAHTGVRVVGESGQIVRVYDTPWSVERIAGINFLPIHGVLFRLDSVRKANLSFNPDLPVLEDWDFWWQLSQCGSFVHAPGCTAIYRQALGQSQLGHLAHPNHWQTWHQRLLLQKVEATPPHIVAGWLAWHAVALDQAASSAGSTHVTSHHQDIRKQLHELQAEHQALVDLYGQREAERKELLNQLKEFQFQHQTLVDLYGRRETERQQLERTLSQQSKQLQQFMDSKPVRLARKLGFDPFSPPNR